MFTGFQQVLFLPGPVTNRNCGLVSSVVLTNASQSKEEVSAGIFLDRLWGEGEERMVI